MRISGTPQLPGTAPIGASTEVERTDATPALSRAASSAASSAASELQSAVMQPALAALRDLPEIDHDKVMALRDALAKGELPFNAGKLAGLIQRFHGGQG